VRRVADSVEPGVPVVGQLPLTVDMIRSVSEDGPRATLFAFGSVVFLAIVLFRDAVTVFQALFTLLLGVAWMFCAVLALNLKINFLNFIAIPITFGIGIDYGVNILARMKKEGSHRILQILSTTGGAVSLASLTTIIGYGSLLLAGNQGFVSFGRLAILGEITCLLAAVFMLPAIVYELDQLE
jgi:predicted RND superfamily exporter protein